MKKSLLTLLCLLVAAAAGRAAELPAVCHNAQPLPSAREATAAGIALSPAFILRHDVAQAERLETVIRSQRSLYESCVKASLDCSCRLETSGSFGVSCAPGSGVLAALQRRRVAFDPAVVDAQRFSLQNGELQDLCVQTALAGSDYPMRTTADLEWGSYVLDQIVLDLSRDRRYAEAASKLQQLAQP